MGDNYTLYEQETIITYNREETFASVYTASPIDIRRLDKLFNERKEEMVLEASTDSSRTYQVPKTWIKIVPKRILTDEQKQALAERARMNFGGGPAHE